jgi:adenosylcobyric acid synthase
MTARAIMVLGTASHVGKSLMTAALCRVFAQHGISVAPFKSQNMSLNSAATPEGLEIGRAQAMQAEAAGIAPSVHMNPILIKPTGEQTSQVWGQVSAADYHGRRVEELMPIVRESYAYVAAHHDVLILEGAGSPAEINLKQHDIVNMRIAEMADARCLLVGDIDRGGVFASLLGTVELLDLHERDRIAGFAVNKFRGDLALLSPGLWTMEQRLGKPCLGVLPYLPALALDEEDSLGLPTLAEAGWQASNARDATSPLRIAVLAFPSLSNFTDLDSLRGEPAVDLRLCRTANGLAGADLILLPGSKQTVDDLLWMRELGLDEVIRAHAEHRLVVGICGGMQMLGRTISDPYGIENQGSIRGLGLLPIDTMMQSCKTTMPATGHTMQTSLFGQAVSQIPVSGYEIHVGDTRYEAHARPFAKLLEADGLQAGKQDGCLSADTRIFGTYLHGIFDDDAFRHIFVRSARKFHGLSERHEIYRHQQARARSFDRLAAAVETNLDLAEIFRWVGLPYLPRKV